MIFWLKFKMFNVQEIRQDFPILHRKVYGKPLVYLDNAATTQKPRLMIDAVSKYYEEYNANVHRGIYTLAEEATAAYEDARQRVAKFIGARNSAEIIFTRGTTEAINLVAYSWGEKFLEKGDTVLLTLMEHHSNLVPWQLLARRKGINLEFIPVTAEGYLEDLEGMIRRLRPKLVAFTHVSNVLGTVNPVKKLIKVAHEVGAVVLVDGAQAMAHLPVNVADLGCDFYAFSGHKMMGPTGVGVLWGRGKILEEMPPFLAGGEMIQEVFLRESSFKDIPYKFEAGTPSIAQVIGLGAAVDYLSALGMENIHRYEEGLLEYAFKKLEAIPGLAIYGPRNSADRGGVIAFNVTGIHPHDLATVLDQDGVAIRSGNHCAMPLHAHFKINASARASFAFYSTAAEVDVLAEAIEGAKKIFKV
jgi:cysteine desulfurase/selenocysteine lyase